MDGLASMDVGSRGGNDIYREPDPIPGHFEIPETLKAIVMKSLAPARANRFATVTELRAALDAVTKLGL